MTTRLECAGVILTVERGEYFVDGEPMKDADHAFTTWASRLYPHNMPLPRAIVRYIRVMAGNQLACAPAMVRKARDEAGMTIPELAKASGVSRWTIRRIEKGSDARGKTLFSILHAAYTQGKP